MTALFSPLLVVTDRHQGQRPLAETISQALEGGARWIWLRERDLARAERRDLGRKLREMTARVGAGLTVGDDIALAEAIGADGVQMRTIDGIGMARARLGDAALIGLSAHSPDEVREAARAGADYATLSPIFASHSKPGHGPALGLEAIGAAAAHGIAVLALGGVAPRRVARCRAAGAAGVAVMGPIMRARSPARCVTTILHEAAATATAADR